nr:hypothetical protein [Algoriella xinjiangensis]
MALNVNDALQALELAKYDKILILGGDILSERNGSLIYAYQLWGDEFQYLNWYCDKLKNENNENYLKRSLNVAKEAIINAKIISEQLNKKCLIVFITD